MKKNKVTQKEIYELWYECVKLNDGYIEWLKTEKEKYKKYLKAYDDPAISLPINANELAESCGFDLMKNNDYHNMFDQWGDVRERTFEDWWTRHGKHTENNPIVVDYADFVNWDMRQCWTNMKDKPSDQEEFEKQFEQAFAKRMKSSPVLNLGIDLNADIEELTKEFRRLVLEAKRKRAEPLAFPVVS